MVYGCTKSRTVGDTTAAPPICPEPIAAHMTSDVLPYIAYVEFKRSLWVCMKASLDCSRAKFEYGLVATCSCPASSVVW